VVYPFFITAAISYSIMASLPFLVSRNIQLIIAVLLGMVANASWVFISRAVGREDIPLYSLYFDIQLTMIYLLVPFLFIEFNLSYTQLLGIALIFTGIVLTHIK